MKTRHEPVTLGSPRSTQVSAQSVDVVSAWFPPHTQLVSHTHSRALFGLMLDGAFRTSIIQRTVDYDAATAWTEPAEERHANVAGARGARVVIIQPAPGSGEMASLHHALFDEVVHGRAGDLMADAFRLAAECERPDDLSPLVVDGLALCILARGARLFRARPHHERAPAWLSRAVEFLRAHCRERVLLGEVARVAGVHPSRLAHEFRAHLRMTPGDFVRGLRLDWAAEELARSDAAIADIALEAGFYDQSHFSRFFRRRFGMTPDGWRQLRR